MYLTYLIGMVSTTPGLNTLDALDTLDTDRTNLTFLAYTLNINLLQEFIQIEGGKYLF